MEETRVLLRNVGVIDPVDAKAYVAAGGYQGLKKALSLEPLQIIEIVHASGLRGRGGAAFPTGQKWQFTHDAEASQKYIVCNADEGEPGTNKDRILLSGDPHAILEAMAIAGKAVGASQGYIYLRGEYNYILPVLEQAIASATAEGLLGQDILGSGFDFTIEVSSGAGAYVCGEETALLESMEGKRGEPRLRPPYPGVAGLRGQPTVVNNVETLANIGPILDRGADWFRSLGTETCPGTKLFTVSGNIVRPGTYEFPMGVNLKALIDFCGGLPEGRHLLAVQTGGASCPVLNAQQIDFNLDVEQATVAGGSLGSGAMLVIDDSNDICQVIANITGFFAHESCGKCTPCREGTRRLHDLADKFSLKQATAKDLNAAKDLATAMKLASFCGLGQTASTALTTAITNFPEAFQTGGK